MAASSGAGTTPRSNSTANPPYTTQAEAVWPLGLSGLPQRRSSAIARPSSFSANMTANVAATAPTQANRPRHQPHHAQNERHDEGQGQHHSLVGEIGQEDHGPRSSQEYFRADDEANALRSPQRDKRPTRLQSRSGAPRGK